jgi:EmrB/QacA subfamily drug resistance transporter
MPATAGINKWVTLIIVAIGTFMATLDASIVNISLPSIARYFGVALTGTVEWVIIAYLVVIAAVLLTLGRLSDRIGRKPLWLLGLAIFTVGSALCGISPSLPLLIAARSLQGLGAAMLFTVGPALLTGSFPARERGRVLGLNAVVVALGTSAGPTLGGVITQEFTWRWIFFINLPLGIIGIVAAWRFLQEQVQKKRVPFDPAGAILLGLGLAAITLALSFGQEWGWTSAGVLGLLFGGVVTLILMAVVEQRVRYPIMNLTLLTNRVFASANASLVLSFLALFAVSFLLPFYFEQLRGYDPERSGLLLTPFPITIAILAPFSGSLADRIGTRWLAAIGLTIACLGLVLLSFLTATSSVWDLVWRLVVTGAGQALFQSPNNSALMGSAPREEQGVAAGFLATGRVIGQACSVALAGAVFAASGATQAGTILAATWHGHPIPPARLLALRQTFVSGLHAAFLTCAAVAAIGIITSLVRGQEGSRRQTQT